LLNWTKFRRDGKAFEWDKKEKNAKLRFNSIYKVIKHEYKGNIENIHKGLIVHARMKYNYENFSRFNTRGLINCFETGISIFYFRECKTPLTAV
jgi:hypothetical protein